MTVEAAIQVIRDKNSDWVRKVEASGWLMDSPITPISYLFECLATRGLPQENAAIALHKRNRPAEPSYAECGRYGRMAE